MKTEKQIQQRLSEIQNSITEINKEINHTFNTEDEVELLYDLDVMIAKKNLLKWVLEN